MLIRIARIALAFAALGLVASERGGAMTETKDTERASRFLGTEGDFVELAQAGNRPPVVRRPIANRRALEGAQFGFTIPLNTFADPDGDSMTIRIRENVDWLRVNQNRRRLSGTALTFDNPAMVRVRATDEHGASVATTFRVSIRPRQLEDDADPGQSTPSLDENGTDDSTRPSISASGRFVAHVFENAAVQEASLVVRDFTLADFSGRGSFTVAGPVAFTPFDAEPGLFSSPSISADGRVVAFVAQTAPEASVQGVEIRVVRIADSNPLKLETKFVETILASADPEARRDLVTSTEVSLSADGRFVAYEQDLDVVVAKIGTRQRLPINGARSPSISSDGRRIAYEEATDSAERRIIVATLDTEAMAKTDEIVAGFDIDSQFGPDPSDPALSADGNFVAFASNASTLVGGDDNGARDIFVFKISDRTLSLVSVDADGDQADGDSSSPSLSGNGGRVAFVTPIPGRFDVQQVLVRGLDPEGQPLGELRLASVNLHRIPGDAFSSLPSLSADGRFVAFESSSSNLTPDAQDNRGTAVFVVPAFPDYAPVVDFPLAPIDDPTIQQLVLGVPTQGVIAPSFDVDQYSVDLIEGQRYRFLLQADASNGRPLGDPYLEIYNGFGELFASDDDLGGGLNDLDALIDFTAPSSDTGFFVVARGVGEATGDYLLTGNLLPLAASVSR